MLRSIEPSFLAAGIPTDPLPGPYVLALGATIALLYRNWRSDEKERREENKEANRAVTAGLDILKDEKHGDRLAAIEARVVNLDKLDALQSELREFQKQVLDRFDRQDRQIALLSQPLQRIVATMPEDEPRATG